MKKCSQMYGTFVKAKQNKTSTGMFPAKKN